MRFALPFALVSTVAAADPPAPPPASPPGMAWVPGGTFVMGDDAGPDDERPAHAVTIAGFWMDRTEVTNAEFARFVAATGYVTTAERPPDQQRFPGAQAGSLVFAAPPAGVEAKTWRDWWQWVPGASWRAPLGPGSSVDGRDAYPVVQVSWDDAVAFARWAGKRLPSEAEFEYAIRAGQRTHFAWGDEMRPGGRWMANIWQGDFPRHDSAEDGFAGLAPVASFPANAYGLNDLAGNVWEWTADWYDPAAYRHPEQAPQPIGDEPRRVVRGGSFLCVAGVCDGFLPTTRMASSPDTGLNHTGFRCVKSP